MAGVLLAQRQGVVFLHASFLFLVFVGLVEWADTRPGGARTLREPASRPRGLVQRGCLCTAPAGSTEDISAMRTN